MIASATPKITSSLPLLNDGCDSIPGAEGDNLRLIVDALEKAIAVTDAYEPRRNPGSSMRQLRTLFSSRRIRTALRRYQIETLPSAE
jgi:hypothetical protein